MMTEPKDDVAQYFDKLSKDWSTHYRRSFLFAQRHDAFNQAVERFADPAGSALDYGCGSGVLTRLLIGRFNRIVATDISEEMRRATELAFASEPSVSVIEPDALLNRVFDLVLCSSVIEYVEEPEEFLLRLRCHLKPGGVLLLSAPNRAGVIQVLHRLVATLRRDSYISYQRHRFAHYAVRDLLFRSGFRVESLSSPVGLPLMRLMGMGELMLCVARRREKQA